MTTGITSLLLANFIGGALSPIFVKLGVGEIPPLTFTAIRFALATIFILPFFLKQKDFNLKSKNTKLILFSSLFFAANVALFSVAIQYTTVIISQFLYSFTPIMVGILGFFMLGEKLNKNRIIGSIIAFSGLIFLLSQSVLKSESTSFSSPVGNIMIFLAVICWSLYMVFSKKVHDKYSTVTISFVSFISTTIILSLFIPFELTIRPLEVSAITLTGIISLLGVAIFSSVTMIYLLQRGIKLSGAFIASLFSYTGPLFAVLSAIPILGEKLTPGLLLGGFLILIGVFYATAYAKIQRIFV